VSPWYWNPEWWQAILIVVGTAIAAAAFLAERRAVRHTQRADVLLQSVECDPDLLERRIGRNTHIVLRFRNFGPTRASQLNLGVTPVVWHEPDRPDKQTMIGTPRLHLTSQVVAAGEPFDITLSALSELVDTADIDDIVAGRAKLQIDVEVTYRDIFEVAHFARSSVRYEWTPGKQRMVISTYAAR
jgi:hypothetical protein